MTLDACAWIDKINTLDVAGIRRLMVDEGIKGVRKMASRCLFTRFIMTKTGVRILTGCEAVRLPTGEDLELSGEARVFVFMFDIGAFKELIDEPGELRKLHGVGEKAASSIPL